MDRGVAIAFLVDFCAAFNLWNVSVDEVRRNYIIPITCETRCRFVDLPIMKDKKEIVGRADTYILYTRKSTFGDLVTSISDGADLKRKVWLDLFASRQWPCSKTDFFIEYAIQRCPSFLVFCPDPAELLNCSDFYTLPAAVKAKIPFFRRWCLYQIYFAAMSNGVNIVVKCGHHLDNGDGSTSVSFIESKETLSFLIEKIDVDSEASVTFEADKVTLLEKLGALPAGSADIKKMNVKLRGVARAAAEISGNPTLHNAACGDKAARKLIMKAPETFIHNVAIAGYLPILTEILKKHPTLVDCTRSDSGRTPLIDAAWGGSLQCVHYLAQQRASLDSQDNYQKTALTYAEEFMHYDCISYLSKKVGPSFYIKHVKTKLFVGLSSPSDDRSVKLILKEFNHKKEGKGDDFLFRFERDQLQHVESGKYAHPFHGRKGPDVNIGLFEDSDEERTSCYPFDYDPTRCLLAGGDNFFVKINWNNELVWHKFWGTNDYTNPFQAKNGFEFEIIFNAEKKNSSSVASKARASVHQLDYHQECERDKMTGKIHEFMFPRSYLVDEVEERPPYNGKIKGFAKGGLCEKTVACDSITQRMLLITANIKKYDFVFGKNPWVEKGCDFGKDDFVQLLSFRLNDLEVVSNCGSEVDLDLQRLSIKLHEDHPYFDSIRVQCVISLQNNPSNVKHICYMEVTAKNSTATLGGKPLPINDGVWSFGTPLPTTQESIGETKVRIFEIEEVEGPLVLTGVGIDNYAGFLFQVAQSDSYDSLLSECFYDKDNPRLTSADITHYNYFESNKKDQTGYREIDHYSTHTVRNLYRELAVEDKQVVVLYQKLNYLYPDITTNPVSKVLPTMLDILERCFADNQISLIQSVIRVSHIKSKQSMINPPVRQIWSTFTNAISLVKQFVLERPNLNMIECAILSENIWDKLGALVVAISQFLIAGVLGWHVLFTGNDHCDVVSIFTDLTGQTKYGDQENSGWLNPLSRCYWRVNFSEMMTIIAVVMSIIKVKTQIQDQSKFSAVFQPLFMSNTHSVFLNRILWIFDFLVNKVLSIITVFLTFFLISKAEQATDLVLNCLAITFIVELDEDLNHRDPVEVNDLVIQSFKNYLIKFMVRKSDEISSKHNKGDCIVKGKSKDNNRPSLFGLFVSKDCSSISQAEVIKKRHDYLFNRLVSADYSSNSLSDTDNAEIKKSVCSYMKEGKLLPILNDIFGGDPDPGKAKYLTLKFSGDIVISVREKLVVDFRVVEKMLMNGGK
eukprot:gene29663-38789_t